MTSGTLAQSQRVIVVPTRSPSTAALLEFLVGFFLQVWGVGHIYAGRVGTGILIMVSYWVLQTINFLLMMVLIGFVTAPLTWLAYAVFSTLGASRAAEIANRAALGRSLRAA